MKRLTYILMACGLAVAVVVGVIVNAVVGEAERVRHSLPTARVVVAATDIPARTDIPASVVQVRIVPDELVYEGAARTVEEVVGKFSPEPIRKGEVINTQKIGPQSAKTAPSYGIDKGKAMYVMPGSLAGTLFPIAQINALRAGDRVDLLYTSTAPRAGLTAEERDAARADPNLYLQTRIMLQDLHIQDVGSFADNGTLLPVTADAGSKTGGPTVDKASIIFVVTPEQALVLKWLRDLASTDKSINVDMILRSPTDEDQTDTNLAVNLEYMRQHYNFTLPEATSPAGGR